MNYRLFRTINGWSGHPALDAVMKIAAKDLILLSFLVLGVLAALALRRRELGRVLAAGVTLASAFLLGLAAAAVHAERRPFQVHRVHQLVAHAPGQSFPSDHATAAFAIALATLFFLSRPLGVALLALAVLIGVSRVYIGVHYPGDILGSLLVAVLAVPAGLVAAMVGRARSTRRPGSLRT